MPTHASGSEPHTHHHRHNREGPCHFSLMSLSATRRLLLCAVPLMALWALVGWAGGWL